jgi:hypothetical protein
MHALQARAGRFSASRYAARATIPLIMAIAMSPMATASGTATTGVSVPLHCCRHLLYAAEVLCAATFPGRESATRLTVYSEAVFLLAASARCW